MFTNNVDKNKERSLGESQSIASVNQNTDQLYYWLMAFDVSVDLSVE